MESAPPRAPIELAELDDLIEHDGLEAGRRIEAALARDPGSAALTDARLRLLLRYSDMPTVVREAQLALVEQPTADRYCYFGIACLHLGRNR